MRSETSLVHPADAPKFTSGTRIVEVAATILSLGTNKLLVRGSGWLTRKGLAKYILPAVLANEAFGAYRAYLAGGAAGFW